MPALAIVTGADAPDLSSDGKRLRATLRDRGHDVAAARWDRETDWDRFDLVLIRSCWEYYQDPAAFRAFVDAVADSSATLRNPPAAVRWNLDKSYLPDLAADVRVVPTEVVAAEEDRRLDAVLQDRGWETAVVKPAVGTSAAGVWTTTRERAAEEQDRFESRFPAARKVGDSAGTDDGDTEYLPECDTVVQEYVPEVESGELSLVFLGGEFDYAWWSVRADRALGVDVSDPKPTADPDPSVVDDAAEVLRAATDRIGVAPGDLTHARVDGVVRDGEFVLLELEMIEPYLNLTAGDAVGRFADVVEARLREASA